MSRAGGVSLVGSRLATLPAAPPPGGALACRRDALPRRPRRHGRRPDALRQLRNSGKACPLARPARRECATAPPGRWAAPAPASTCRAPAEDRGHACGPGQHGGQLRLRRGADPLPRGPPGFAGRTVDRGVPGNACPNALPARAAGERPERPPSPTPRGPSAPASRLAPGNCASPPAPRTAGCPPRGARAGPTIRRGLRGPRERPPAGAGCEAGTLPAVRSRGGPRARLPAPALRTASEGIDRGARGERTERQAIAVALPRGPTAPGPGAALDAMEAPRAGYPPARHACRKVPRRRATRMGGAAASPARGGTGPARLAFPRGILGGQLPLKTSRAPLDTLPRRNQHGRVARRAPRFEEGAWQRTGERGSGRRWRTRVLPSTIAPLPEGRSSAPPPRNGKRRCSPLPAHGRERRKLRG